MKRPPLIPGWQHATRLWSVRVLLALVALNLAGAVVALLSEDFPSRAWFYVNTILAAAGAVLRVLQQADALAPRAACESPPPAASQPMELAPDEQPFKHPTEH